MKKNGFVFLFFGLMIGILSALIFIWGIYSLNKQIPLEICGVVFFLLISLMMNMGAIGVTLSETVTSIMIGVVAMIAGIITLLMLLNIPVEMQPVEPVGILLALTVIMVLQGLSVGEVIKEVNILFFSSMLIFFSLCSLGGSYFVINILK